MCAYQNSTINDGLLCESAGVCCPDIHTLSKDELESFIAEHDLDLDATTQLQYDARDPLAGTIEAALSDEYDEEDPAGSASTLNEQYTAATDDLASAIETALIREVGDQTAVNGVLQRLRSWKHGSYKIHTPEAVPSALMPDDSDDALAHYAQTHELVCKEALSSEAAVRNDRLDGDSPSDAEVRTLQYIHGLSRYFLTQHLPDDAPVTLYRGVGGVAFAEVGRQLIDDEDPPLEVDEQAVLANFTPSRHVAKSFRGLLLSIQVPPEAIAVAADQLFKCRDENNEVTNRHAEIRVVTDCYRDATSLDCLELPSGTKAYEFLQNPTSDNLEDHRFMASLLANWFWTSDGEGAGSIPETSTGFDRIEAWYEHYEELLQDRQRVAFDNGDDDWADRLHERLTIVNDLKNRAEAIREERGL